MADSSEVSKRHVGRGGGRDPAFETALGARIRALRLAAGMSQGALGQAVGVSFQQVQKYERGMDRVTVSTLVALAAALGVHPGAFFDGDIPAPTGTNSDKRAVLKAGAMLQRIRDPRVLKQLLAFAEALGEGEGP